MPQRDKTGPNGEGPKTGRGFGYCNENNQPNFSPRRGFGRNQGRGFGFRRFRREPITLSNNDQVEILKQEKNQLEQELKEINDKLEEIQ